MALSRLIDRFALSIDYHPRSCWFVPVIDLTIRRHWRWSIPQASRFVQRPRREWLWRDECVAGCVVGKANASVILAEPIRSRTLANLPAKLTVPLFPIGIFRTLVFAGNNFRYNIVFIKESVIVHDYYQVIVPVPAVKR